MPDPVVSIRRLVKRYGAFEALAGVDLDIRAGEIFALLGPNGAGKTTLISIVAGLVRATAGEVTVLGHDVVRDHRAARAVLGVVPQEINFDPFFTVEEALRLQAGYFGVRLSEARLVELLSALDLSAKRKANTRTLSGGMKRRLLIGKALAHEPRVVFLDEPTAGVDVELRQSLWRYVRLLRERGTTIVLTTHYLDEAEELADRVGVIDRGRLLVVDDKTALMRRHASKSLRVALEAPVAALPPGLAALGAELAAGRAGGDAGGLAGRLLRPGALRLRRGRPARAGRGDAAHEPGGRLRAAPARRARAAGGGRAVNGFGLRTLLEKEIRRFLRVPGQTLLSPIVTTALYFVVFGVSLGSRLREVEGVPYARFIVPGLVALGVVSNAFLNAASSLFVMKLQGTVVDLLLSPLGPGEILTGFVGAAALRGLLVGAVTWLVAAAFTGFGLAHPLFALAMVALLAVAFGALGFMTAVWATTFEQVNFFPTFVITPLTFLGGVFYSVKMLPAGLLHLTLFNPVFYLVDGLRYGMLGLSDAPPWAGLAIAAVLAGGRAGGRPRHAAERVPAAGLSASAPRPRSRSSPVGRIPRRLHAPVRSACSRSPLAPALLLATAGCKRSRSRGGPAFASARRTLRRCRPAPAPAPGPAPARPRPLPAPRQASSRRATLRSVARRGPLRRPRARCRTTTRPPALPPAAPWPSRTRASPPVRPA